MGLFDRLMGREPKKTTLPPVVRTVAKKAAGSSGARPAKPDIDYGARHRAAQKAGIVRGKHFSEWADVVGKLRKDGQLDKSLALAYECIEATERQAAVDGNGVAPGHYRNAAIVLRRQKRYAEEVEVLDRYLKHGSHPDLADRRRKATALRDAEVAATVLACPLCGTVLESPPKQRGKCPSCSAPLVMRTVNGQRAAMTPEQAEAWTTADKAQRRREEFLRQLGYYGVTEVDWEKTQALQAERFGARAADGDVFWQIANEVSVNYESTGQWDAAARVRNTMAKFLVEEGREWVHTAELAEQASMKAAFTWDTSATEMILIACKCLPCQKDNLKVATLSQFAAAWPLPHPDCEKPPCRCGIRKKLY